MALSRGARFILIFISIAVLFSVGSVIAAYFLATGGPAVRSSSVLWLRVPANLTERAPEDLVGQLIARRETVGSVVTALRMAKVDDRIEAVVLVPPLQQGLWGKVQEIRDAVIDYKESGKPIVAYLEYGGGQQYYLATACDEIFMTPTSPLDLVGVASYELFLRDALDKLGVVPDMLHAGDFKTASNLYTETTFTPEHREMTEALNRDLYDQLVRGIAEGRTMSLAETTALIDQGPLLPETAREAGLVDALLYEDEVLERLGLTDEPRLLPYADYRQLDPRSLDLNRGPRVAVVHAVGTITFGESGVDIGGSEVLGAETLVRAIREAGDDDEIRAIILRIDSPGGAAIAADIIWRAVTLAKAKKPVIASMSDLAASGGYYVAMPADQIVAQPATLTGSIGVVGGKLAMGGALDKLGINVEAVSDGRVAEMYSPIDPFSDEARDRVQTQIDAVYETFVAKAATGRSMTPEAVHAVAQGRVWTGRQAKAVGLVDELGGLQEAVSLAKDAAGIESSSEVTLVTYPRRRSVFEMLSRSLAGATLGGRQSQWLSSVARARALVTMPLRLFHPGEPLAFMPVFVF